MVRPEVIRKRLGKLDEYLAILQNARSCEREEFLRTPERYGSAERFLQLSIETINDMASHVVAEEQLGTVNAARDLPRFFKERGYLDEELAQRWTRMIGFRNILVHDYLDVDRSLVYEVIQHEIGDLTKLRCVFARFL